MLGEIILFVILPTIIFFNILYLIIRAAVRDGIIQAEKQRLKDGRAPEIDAEKVEIAPDKTLCQGCNTIYAKKWPLCPYCATTKRSKKYNNNNEEEKL
ncbi:MAG: hypothetical protein LBE35_05395 [Clostridiales bacterium]|jgi:hypothetical protein|nr:hypothetical protein [Clostridiales bacterium]